MLEAKPMANHIMARKEDRIAPAARMSQPADPNSQAQATHQYSTPKATDSISDSQAALLPNQKIHRRASISMQASDFYDRSSTPAMQTVIMQILEKEAPIQRDALVTTVRQAWGFNRAGTKIQERVAACVRSLPTEKRPKLVGTFFWPNGIDPSTYTAFRTPDAGDPNPRPIQEIPPEELANAALALIGQYGSMTRDDLLRSTANIFGISRLGTNVKDAVENALQKLVKAGRVRLDGEQVMRD